MTSQVFVGGTLIDGTGGPAVDDAAVVVEGGVVTYAGPANSLPHSKDRKVVDVNGLVLTPGFVDCHVHLTGSWSSDPVEWVLEDDLLQAVGATAQLLQLLDNGVTTVRDISRIGLRLRTAVDRGLVPGPHIVPCGPGISRTGGTGDLPSLPRDLLEVSHPWGGVFADTSDELRRAVRSLHRSGSEAIKVWATGGGMWAGDRERDQHYDESDLRLVVKEARALHLPVLAHCENDRGARAAARAGAVSIEHGEDLSEETLDAMLRAGTFLVPTLSLFRGGWFSGHDDNGTADGALRRVNAESNFQRVLERGVRLAIGSDSVSSAAAAFGRITLAEIQNFIELGMRPEDALVCATRAGADLLGLGSRIGTIEAGKQADLVGLSRDPRDGLDAFDPACIALVVSRGRIHKDELGRKQ